MDRKSDQFGRLLKKHRNQKGVSQQWVAERAFGRDGDRKQISGYENGRYLPQAPNIKALVDTLEIPQKEVDDILTPGQEEAPAEQSLKYRSVYYEARIFLRIASRWVGRPFSVRLFFFSLSIAQVYSIFTFYACWLVIGNESNFANLQFFPRWNGIGRIVFSFWIVLFVYFLIKSVLQIKNEHSQRRRYDFVVLAVLIYQSVTPIWIYTGITYLCIFAIILSYDIYRFKQSRIFVVFIGLSIYGYSFYLYFNENHSLFIKILLSTVTSGYSAFFALRSGLYLNKLHIVYAFIFSTVPLYFLSDEIDTFLSLLIVTSFGATLGLTQVSSSSFNINVFQRFGILILLCATVISASWPSAALEPRAAELWPVFFVVMPLWNSIVDFLSLSISLHIWSRIVNFLEVGKSLPASFWLAAEFVVIVLLSGLFLLVLFLSLMGLEVVTSGDLDLALGALQFSNDPLGSGVWVIVLMTTIFAPTCVAWGWLVLFASRPPKKINPGDIVRVSQQTNYWVTQMHSERMRLRIAFWVVIFALLIFLDFHAVAAFGVWILDAIGFSETVS